LIVIRQNALERRRSIRNEVVVDDQCGGVCCPIGDADDGFVDVVDVVAVVVFDVVVAVVAIVVVLIARQCCLQSTY